MLRTEMAAALSEQMAFEFYSAYLYLGMAARLEDLRFPGMAHWMERRGKEELTHAEKFYRYLADERAQIEFGDISKPVFEGRNPLDIFKSALAHERKVSARINALSSLALEQHEFAVLGFLDDFHAEQREEERIFGGIVDNLTLAENHREALLFIDYDLSKRE